MPRYDALVDRLRSAALPSKAVPPAAEAFLAKVRTAAATITDADVAELARAGLDEETIFELTVQAALGEGLRRLEIGIKAMKGANDAAQDGRAG
jgi:alkylhydroperoxidase family enzyme